MQCFIMEHLAMCDSSITTSRVCCVTGGQNSLFSIILGVILKCYHLFGLQPPLQASAVVLKTGEHPTFEACPSSLCLRPEESHPCFVSRVPSLPPDFSSSHATADPARRRQWCGGSACGCPVRHLQQNSLCSCCFGTVASVGTSHCRAPAQVSCVAARGGPDVAAMILCAYLVPNA